MSILKINGTAIKHPQTLKWDISDLDSEDGAGRDQQGVTHRDRVAIKRKISCTWGPMTNAEISALLSAMDAQSFTLNYPDAHDGAEKSGTFYVGDRSAPLYMWNTDKQMYLWEGLSANFVEM